MSSAQQPAEMWLDRIPEGWQIIPAKVAFTERRQKSRPTDVHLTPSQKYGVLPQSEYMQISGSKVVLNLEGQDNMKHVEANDFIIHLRSFQGGIEWSDISGKVSMAYTVLTPRGCKISPAYYRWVLKADAYIQELRSTTDQLRDGQSIKYSTFAKIQLPLPPLDEQRVIADYLDQETAQIDALVAKQEAFIGLLGERRTAAVAAIIYKAGSELGRPDKLHRHVNMGNGSTPRSGESRYYDGGSIPWVNSSVVNHSEVDQPSKLITPAAVAECHLPMVKPGSILVALTGQGKTRGAATISRISTTINQHLAFIEPDINYWVPEYLLWLLHSKYDHLRRISSENGATKGGLTVGDLRALPVNLPGRETQIKAVEEIDSAVSRIDTLIAKAEEHIALAKERRSALVTAAVTGRFDVRTAKKGARV